jgi:hypothetical protein
VQSKRGFRNSRNFRTPYGKRRAGEKDTSPKAVGEFLRTILEKTRGPQAVPAPHRLKPCPDLCRLTWGVHPVRGFSTFRTFR